MTVNGKKSSKAVKTNRRMNYNCVGLKKSYKMKGKKKKKKAVTWQNQTIVESNIQQKEQSIG